MSKHRCWPRSQADGGPVAEAVHASSDIEAAAQAVAAAEHELDLFVNNPTLLTMLGEARFVEGVQVRQQALDEARETLGQLRSQSELAVELERRRPAQGLARTDRSREKRRLLHGLLDRVVVTPGDGRGRHANPISERTQIILRGGIPLESQTSRLDGRLLALQGN